MKPNNFLTDAEVRLLFFSSVLNATPETNAFLSFALLSTSFFSNDVLGKHVGLLL